MTLWTKRGFFIIANGVLVAATNAAKGIQNVGETADDQADTFSVPLSPTGNDPATHKACNTALTEVMAAAWITEIADNHTLPSARYWIVDLAGLLTDTNAGGVVGQADSWQDAIDDVNLQVIVGGADIPVLLTTEAGVTLATESGVDLAVDIG